MKLTNPFKGCGDSTPHKKVVPEPEFGVYGTRLQNVHCGTDGVYCEKCLVARINHLEEQLVMAHCDSHETDTNTEEVIRAGFKQRAAIWSRQCINSTKT